MAFFRFSRDKRGYEHFYLMQPSGRGRGRPRLLYWFRTPPNVRVGRGPFEPEIRRDLEAQNPEVVFDWKAIVQTPIPPADTERWRERRRAERLMRAATESEEKLAEPSEEPQAEIEPGPATAEPAATSKDVVSEAGGAHRRRRRRRRRKSQEAPGDREPGEPENHEP